MGGAAGEPSSSEEGGQGGVDSVDPLEWKLELQLVEPTPHQLELARAAAGDPASSGLIAVSEDSARVSRDGHVLSGYAYIGIDDPRATRGWRCLLP